MVQGLLAAAGEVAVAVELQLGVVPRLIVGRHRDTTECSLVVDIVAGIGAAVAGIVACHVP